MSFYEKFVSPKRIHYMPYWIILGILFLLLTELMAWFCGEKNFLAFYLLIAFGGFPLFGIIFNLIKNSFYSAITEYSTIAIFPTQDMNTWIVSKSKEFFGLTTTLSRLFVLFVDIGVITMLVFSGSPFNTKLFLVYFLIAAQPCFIIGSHGAYTLIALLVFLTKILKFPVKAPFYLAKPPAIMHLFNFYSRASFMVLLLYVWAVLLIWQSPYGFAAPLTIFLIIIGFYPLAMLLWSIIQFNGLLKRIKDEHIAMINAQIQTVLTAVKKRSTRDKVEQLSGLMEIQRETKKTSEWPIEVEGLFTVFATILVPIVNVMLAAFNVLKP